jgi:neutral ceramidase
MSTLLAAAARVKLDPPAGVAMIGYGGRVGRSTGVHDDLASQALVLSDGTHKAAIAGVDVLAIGCRIVDEIRERVAKRTDIERDAILIAATHTHSGPAFNIWATPKPDAHGGGPDRDLEWERSFPERVADAICEANARLAPAAMRAARARFTLGTNRRLAMPNGDVLLAPNYAGVADADAQALGLYQQSGEALAVVMNYPCHGVVLCEDNLLFSRDYPGFALDEFEKLARERHGGGPIGIFLNGATGNIDPRDRGTFELAAEHGRALGRACFDALEAAPVLQPGPLTARRIPLRLKLKDLETALATARRFFAQTERSLASHRGGDGYHLEKLRGHHARAAAMLKEVEMLVETNRRDRRVDAERGEMTTSLSIVTLGRDLAIVGLPGEAFVEFGLALKANPWFRHTIVAGYCNDLIMYIPTREAYADGGYEVDSARVAAGSGEQIVATALAQLAEIAAASPD